VLVESLLPPWTLFLAGSGEELAAIARIAGPLDWTVERVVPRPTALAERRFAGLLSGPTLAPAEIPARATPRSAIVVASHNYLDDLEVLRIALATPLGYVGLLGSHGRVSRLRADAGDLGDPSRVHGPAGLDIGAETPEEIAVSIVAEIQAVLAGRFGGKLRSRRSPIHDRAAEDDFESPCAAAGARAS
jgi:xanthine/CO dehydrogenase XdhC/CoxF family maturation factor